MSDPRRTSSASSSSGGRLRSFLGKNVRALSFIPRERRFYDLFEQQAATIVRSAGLLERALANVTDLPVCQREIKDLENQGDEITRDIVLTLNRTFVTPFDHEDIYALASGLDDILDYIEEVADTANLYRITTIPEPARACRAARQSWANCCHAGSPRLGGGNPRSARAADATQAAKDQL
jgi:uncharacterized protein Yka (UPF0111/DUF47 family)